jgi:hypothetical protein
VPEDYCEDHPSHSPVDVSASGTAGVQQHLRHLIKRQPRRHAIYEREDVVDYRDNTFLPMMTELKSKMVEFSINPERPDLLRAHAPDGICWETGERPIVPTYQDESTYNANDGWSKGWVTEDWYPLRPKGEGAGINVSDFVTPAGRLRAPEGTRPDRLPKHGLAEGLRMDASHAALVMECGKGTWWNADALIKQLEEVTIPIFNLAFPDCRALFIFDNATLHRSYKEDALRARNVNLYPAGKQALMRPGRELQLAEHLERYFCSSRGAPVSWHAETLQEPPSELLMNAYSEGPHCLRAESCPLVPVVLAP